MDTAKLKRFATEARTVLMEGVKNRLKGLTFDLKTGQPAETPREMQGGAIFMGQIVSIDFCQKWHSLVRDIERRSIGEVAEEVAYTWFNRLVAIRIMARQGFVSPVLEYESDDTHVPIIVAEARQGRYPSVISNDQRESLLTLLDDDSKTNEQFAILIVAYCHSNPVIQKCFGNLSDYSEFLLPQNILAEGGFVSMLNQTTYITEEDFRSPELIGWLYQFYISEKKDAAFAKKGKYDPDEIPAATQIFTPNWIVKYMTQSTLGNIYLDNNPYEDISEEFPYMVRSEAKEGEKFIYNDLSDLKCADLACGSGHILNELFDRLFWMYMQDGYRRTTAVKNIFQKNLLGIDLDTRAKQLATFALLMKACQQDPEFANAEILPRVYDMPRPIEEVIPEDWAETDAKEFLRESIPHYMLGSNSEMTKEISDAILLMNHADTLGSIMRFDLSESTRNAIMIRTQEYEEQLAKGEFVPEAIQLFIPYMNIILALTDRYAVLCMNPPYMGSGRFDDVLSKYTKDNYPRSKADLFSIFMDVAVDRLARYGKYGMINMHSWMFLSSFEDLRRDLLNNYSIDSLLHLGPRTFDELSGEVVQNAAFVITNSREENCVSSSMEQLPHYNVVKIGTYFRLVDGKNCADKERMYLEALEEHTEKVYYGGVGQEGFISLPGLSIGYWINHSAISKIQSADSVSDYYTPRKGMCTRENTSFVRNWHEVTLSKIGFNVKSRSESKESKKKWFPYQKGGEFRLWYGNNYNVVDWENDGYKLLHMEELGWPFSSTNHNLEFIFKPAFVWSKISSGRSSIRLSDFGYLYDDASGLCASNGQKSLEYVVGLMSSKVGQFYLKLINPTLNIQPGNISAVPMIFAEEETVTNLVKDNISISRLDWDCHETSWDFKRNELLRYAEGIVDAESEDSLMTDASLNLRPKSDISSGRNKDKKTVASAYEVYKQVWEARFMQLHANEEELNRKFIEIYGLQDELTKDVPLDEITILQQGEISIVDNRLVWHDDVVMKQLISYAVGCMMGRYSIDKEGLILANQGDGLKEYAELVPDSRFDVDDDGIVPLMSSDTEFTDTATKRFKNWLSVTFGEDNLVDNINFIEGALGKSLDDYFIKDFWKDHKKMYQNRPIYWLFSSKKGAFQVLAYMHRMNPYTAERIRSNYLLPHIEWLLNKQQELQDNAANLSTRERRELDNIAKQIVECREYHEKLHIIADQQIPFDLDDGVVVNYAKFGEVLAKIK